MASKADEGGSRDPLGDVATQEQETAWPDDPTRRGRATAITGDGPRGVCKGDERVEQGGSRKIDRESMGARTRRRVSETMGRRCAGGKTLVQSGAGNQV